jgi:hypothetical protein
MTWTRNTHRRIGGIAVVVAVALCSSAVPAAARTFGFNSAGSMIQQPLPSGPQRTAQGTGSSDWSYIAIGSSAAGLALIGVGGTLTGSRRRRTTPHLQRSRIGG